MTGMNAIQGVVVVFSLILAILLFAIVVSYRRSQKSKMASVSSDGKGTEVLPELSETRRETVREVPMPTAEKERAPQPLTAVAPAPAAALAPESVNPEESTTLEKALSGTKQRLWGRLSALWSGSSVAGIEEIEEVLYTSDLGPQTVESLLEGVRESLSRSEKKDPEVVRSALRGQLLQIFEKTQTHAVTEDLFASFQFHQPTVWMVVGVNGAGKTTSIGKMAAHLAQRGKKVLVAAGDTFRAAAGSQLKVWTERAQVEIFSPEGVTDPSAVAFDAVQKGVAKHFDVIIVDTAGRLHTQQNLMEEIKKMKRVVQKVLPEAPHEVLLVLDSNQGQNALLQAKEFHKSLGVTGVILTKLDGTAKGGVAVGVANELELPIKLIGVGEKMGDLRPFSAKSFVDSII